MNAILKTQDSDVYNNLDIKHNILPTKRYKVRISHLYLDDTDRYNIKVSVKYEFLDIKDNPAVRTILPHNFSFSYKFDICPTLGYKHALSLMTVANLLKWDELDTIKEYIFDINANLVVNKYGEYTQIEDISNYFNKHGVSAVNCAFDIIENMKKTLDCYGAPV